MIAPELFDSAMRYIEDLRDGCLAHEAQLEELEAQLVEAEELFTKLLDIARRQREKDIERLCEEREEVAAFRAEVVEEAVQNQELRGRVAAHEEEVRWRKVNLWWREEELGDRAGRLDYHGAELVRPEEQLALRVLEAAGHEEALEHREIKATKAEGARALSRRPRRNTLRSVSRRRSLTFVRGWRLRSNET